MALTRLEGGNLPKNPSDPRTFPAIYNELVDTVEEIPDFRYRHVQDNPSSFWTVSHNLSGYPSVTVVDSSSSVIEGHVTYINEDTITVEFASEFGGEAYLS